MKLPGILSARKEQFQALVRKNCVTTVGLSRLIFIQLNSGLESDVSTVPSTVLRYIRLPIAANLLCSTTYGSAVVSDANVCLQSINRGSTCQG